VYMMYVCSISSFIILFFSLFFKFYVHSVFITYVIRNVTWNCLNLRALPVYNLSDSQLFSLLRLDKIDIMNQDSQLKDYITHIDCTLFLNELKFNYVTDVEFNNKVSAVRDCVELSVIHLNIRSLNCNHSALCQFLDLLILQFDVIILSEIWPTNIDFYLNILPGYFFIMIFPRTPT